MRILAELDMEPVATRRSADRHRSATRGTARPFKGQAEPIEVIDISTHGCGFEARWPFAAGARLWLALPGLEPWAAMVVWYDDGRGGLQFARPLHPMVVARYAAV